MAPGAPGAHRCGADPSFAGTPPPELGRPGLRSLLPPAHPRHGDRRALYEWPLTVDSTSEALGSGRGRVGGWLPSSFDSAISRTRRSSCRFAVWIDAKLW